MTLYYLAFQNTTSPNNTAYTWNSFTTPQTTLTTALVDSDGTASAISVLLTSYIPVKASTGVNAVGTGDAAWVNQARISEQGWYTSQSYNIIVMRFAGLDNAKRYDFNIFGSRNSDANLFNLNSAIDGVTITVSTSMNSSRTAEFRDIAPTSGHIDITFTCNSSASPAFLSAIRMTEHDVKTHTIDTITDPVEAGGTITFTTSGFSSLTAINTNQTGITVSGITGVDGTATVTGWTNNAVYPDLPISLIYTFTDGTNSDSIDGTVTKPAAYTRLPMASPVLTAGYLAGDILAQTGRTHVSSDVMFHTTYDDFALAADTGYTVSSEGSIDLWVRVAAGADAGKMFQYTVTITESGAVVVDTDPDPFTFGTRTNVAISTVTQGNVQAVIEGVTADTDIEATPSGGLECRVSSDEGGTFGSWTDEPFNVQLGYVIEGRVESSASYNTLVTGSLTIGTTVGTLQVTTRLSDASPDDFSFESVTGVTPGAIVASPTTVTISGVDPGIDIPTEASEGLEYRFDDGGGYSDWTSAPNDLRVGWDVQVRLAASESLYTTTVGTLTMGGVEGTFTVRSWSSAGGGGSGGNTLSFRVLRFNVL